MVSQGWLRVAYNENQAKVVGSGPLERVRVLLVKFPISARLHTLLDQDIADEAVDDAGVHGGVLLRPEENAGCGDDFEGVQSGPCCFGHDGTMQSRIDEKSDEGDGDGRSGSR